MSKKVTIKADNTTSVQEAEIMDIVSTAMSTDQMLTGTYNLLQKLAFVGVGMVVQSKRKLNTFNPL